MSWPFGVATSYLGTGRQNWYDSYGSLQLTEGSPYQSSGPEPVSLTEAKAAARIIDGLIMDDQLDSRLNMLISAARSKAEEAQGRRFVQSQWDLVYDYWPGRKIRLSPPLVSVDLVQYTDVFGNVVPLVPGTDYMVDRAKVPPIIAPKWNHWWPAFSPAESSSILIRHTVGYSPDHPFWTIDKGKAIKEGMLKLIQFWLTNATPIEKALGTAEELPWTVTELFMTGRIINVG